MINFLFSILILAIFTVASFVAGCIGGAAAAIDRLADGDDEKKLEICEKLKKNNTQR